MADLRITLYNNEKPPLRNTTYAPRISTAKWDKMKPVIRKMFDQNMTQEQMLESLRDQHDFRPSRGQLVAQLSSWRLRRYKPREMVDSATVVGSDTLLHLAVHYIMCRILIRKRCLGGMMLQNGDLENNIIRRLPQLTPSHVFRRVVRHHYSELLAYSYVAGGELPITFPDLSDLILQGASAQQLADIMKPWRDKHTSLILGPKISTGFDRPYELESEVIDALRRSLSRCTMQEQYDIAHFNGIMYLASMSKFEGDNRAFEIHRQGAHTVLQGILHMWGEGGHEFFKPYINSLRTLDLLDPSASPDVQVNQNFGVSCFAVLSWAHN